nr:ATP-dependent DNA ligase [Sicyoidochytrium minutum DNA virus]
MASDAFKMMMAKSKRKPVFKCDSLTLAHSYNEHKHEVVGWWWSEKLDGVRALWNGIELLTRAGKTLNCHLSWVRRLPDDIALDGELFLDRGMFSQVMSIVRTRVPTDRWLDIKFAVFDAPSIGGTYRERHQRLRELKESGVLPSFVHIVEQHTIEPHTCLKTKLQEVLATKGEGLMLRNPEMQYEQKRTNNLLKLKGVEDYDAKVVQVLPGEGKHRGRVGAIRCEIVDSKTKEKRLFNIGTGFTDHEREFDNAPSVGEWVRFRCMEFTPAGIPRFPVFMNVIMK